MISQSSSVRSCTKIPKIHAGFFCRADKGVASHTLWLLLFENIQPCFHGTQASLAFLQGPITQKDLCGILSADYKPIPVEPTELNVDRLVKASCCHRNIVLCQQHVPRCPKVWINSR